MSKVMVFKPRTEAPGKNNPFYYSNDNVFHRCNYGMPNCTCYALGRFAEITGIWLNKHRACLGNAETWYDSAIKAGLMVSQSPRLGAIACWCVGDKSNPNDGCGHVAIVEEITKTGDILTSNSAYKGTEFYMQYFYLDKGYCWVSKISNKSYNFLGFIYPEMFIKEPCALLRPSKSTHLKLTTSLEAKKLKVLNRTDLMVYDGVYCVAEGIKWGHVRTAREQIKAKDIDTGFPVEYCGWVNLNHTEVTF